ncbi:MAG: acyltransferase [Aquabacterium sp.]
MRAKHIDVARALCIVLVVFGHSELAKHFSHANGILTSFRMPLFFIIAGSFFAPRHSLTETIVRKGDALIKPYLALAVLYAPFYLHGHPDEAWLSYGSAVLSFNGQEMPGRLMPLWFLTLLWALHVGCRLFVQATGFERADRSRQVCWTIVLLLVGYTLLRGLGFNAGQTDEAMPLPNGLPFSLQLWPLSAFFFLTGYLLSREIRSWSLGRSATLVAALVFATLHLQYKPSMDLLQHHYADLVVTTVAALSGALAVIGLSHELARIPAMQQILAPLGRRSLYVLMFHAPLLTLTTRLLVGLREDLPSAWLATASLLLSVAASYVLGNLIRQMPALRLLFEPRHRFASAGRPPAPAMLTPDLPDDTSEAIRLQS